LSIHLRISSIICRLLCSVSRSAIQKKKKMATPIATKQMMTLQTKSILRDIASAPNYGTRRQGPEKDGDDDHGETTHDAQQDGGIAKDDGGQRNPLVDQSFYPTIQWARPGQVKGGPNILRPKFSCGKPKFPLERKAESWIVNMQMPIRACETGGEFQHPKWRFFSMSTKDKINPHMRTILAACAAQQNPQDLVDYLTDAIQNGTKDNNFGLGNVTPESYSAADDWMDQQLQKNQGQ
jgi:hypothetical protein